MTETNNELLLVPVEPQPTYIESSGRWKWPLPEKACFPGCCTDVVTASREWWEYAPTEAKPHPFSEGVQLRDGKWYWTTPVKVAPPAETAELVRLCDTLKRAETMLREHANWSDGVEVRRQGQGYDEAKCEMEKALQSTPEKPPVAFKVPTGYALVPVEPTDEMIEAAGVTYQDRYDIVGPQTVAKMVYQTMLEASPPPAGGSYAEKTWMDIETAPKDGTRVRLLCPDGEDIGHYDEYDGRYGGVLPGEWSTDNGNGEPTHWKPLAAPTSQEEATKERQG